MSKTIVEQYNAGATLKSLSELHGKSIHLIKKDILAFGGELKTRNFNWKPFDEDFFEVIDSEHKAYWLGFMFGDGTVFSDLKQFKLQLSAKDTDHVVKFALAIGAKEDDIRSETQITTFGPFTSTSLKMTSTKTVADLISHGCIPRKTHITCAPSGVPKELEAHFIRGLFDADGNVGLYGRRELAEISISGDIELIHWCAKILNTHNLPRPHSSLWRIRATGRSTIPWIEQMYKDANVVMDRKFNLAQKIVAQYV